MKRVPLSLPSAFERIIGFTIPQGGVFHVCDHDEVCRVVLSNPPTLTVIDRSAYEFIDGRSDFLGLVFEGSAANKSIQNTEGVAIACSVNAARDLAEITYRTRERSGRIEFNMLARDWFAASLSDDGRYLVLAEPHSVAVYETV